MTTFDKLVASVNLQLASEGLSVDAADLTPNSHTIYMDGLMTMCKVQLIHRDPAIAPFSLTYPLSNLAHLQFDQLKTNVIVDLPSGHSLESLLESVNQALPEAYRIEADAVELRTLYDSDGQLRYALYPVADTQTPTYTGILELYAIDPRKHALGLHALLAEAPLVVADIRHYFTSDPTLNRLIPLDAYIGHSDQLEYGLIDSWPHWTSSAAGEFYMNHTALIPERAAGDTTDYQSLYIQAAETTPGQLQFGSGREIMLSASEDVLVDIRFQVEQDGGLVTVDRHQRALEQNVSQLVQRFGIPENATLKITPVDRGDLALQAGVRYLIGQRMTGEYVEYRPLVQQAGSRKSVLFTDHQALHAPSQLLMRKTMSMGAEVLLRTTGGDTIIQTLSLDGLPVVEVLRVGNDLVGRFTYDNQVTEVHLPIVHLDEPFFYRLGWGDGKLVLCIRDREEQVTFNQTGWREHGLAYKLGGSGQGSFELYRHYLARRNDQIAQTVWSSEYWR